MTQTARPRKSIRVPVGLGANPHVIFLALLRQNGLPEPSAEYPFASPRRWRFDYAWVMDWGRTAVALEVEGAIWTRGRHSRGKGMLADMEKYNEAALRGWTVLRVTPQQLPTLATIALLQRALNL